MTIDEARERYVDEVAFTLGKLAFAIVHLSESDSYGDLAWNTLAQFAANIHNTATADEREECAVIAETFPRVPAVIVNMAQAIADRIREREEAGQ